jgi:hypothetical protein
MGQKGGDLSWKGACLMVDNYTIQNGPNGALWGSSAVFSGDTVTIPVPLDINAVVPGHFKNLEVIYIPPADCQTPSAHPQAPQPMPHAAKTRESCRA